MTRTKLLDDALIFDCDGVLVNSEQIAQEVELKFLASVGMIYPRDEYVRRFSGTSEQGFREALRADAGARFSVKLPDEFFDDMAAAIVDAYEGRLEAIAGAVALAAAWPRLKAVASSSSKGTLLLKLGRVGLADLFGAHIYSADAVGAGKPDPALFVFAAGQLGVAPARCIVVEDSVNGIVAARRAGMTAIGFVGGGHCLDDQDRLLLDAGAERVFDSHCELASYLDLAR